MVIFPFAFYVPKFFEVSEKERKKERKKKQTIDWSVRRNLNSMQIELRWEENLYEVFVNCTSVEGSSDVNDNNTLVTVDHSSIAPNDIVTLEEILTACNRANRTQVRYYANFAPRSDLTEFFHDSLTRAPLDM